jgi:hypothetical protein
MDKRSTYKMADKVYQVEDSKTDQELAEALKAFNLLLRSSQPSTSVLPADSSFCIPHQDAVFDFFTHSFTEDSEKLERYLEKSRRKLSFLQEGEAKYEKYLQKGAAKRVILRLKCLRSTKDLRDYVAQINNKSCEEPCL